MPSAISHDRFGIPTTLIRCVRPFKVIYKRRSTTVDLPGYHPKGDGDGVHVGNDMNVIDRALRMLKQKVDGIRAQATIAPEFEFAQPRPT